MKEKNIKYEEIEKIRKHKKETRGSFKERIFLKEVIKEK
jgi:hypothetical protein